MSRLLSNQILSAWRQNTKYKSPFESLTAYISIMALLSRISFAHHKALTSRLLGHRPSLYQPVHPFIVHTESAVPRLFHSRHTLLPQNQPSQRLFSHTPSLPATQPIAMAEPVDRRSQAAAWLSAAVSAPISPSDVTVIDMEALNETPIIEESGPNFTSRPSYGRQLATVEAALTTLPRDAPALYIDGDTPHGEEWALFGQHFSGPRHLVVSTGFLEHWDDENFPLGWAGSLETLLITDACGELVTTPVVLEGQVEHLVLLLTCGLRFEGLSSAELMRRMMEERSQAPDDVAVQEEAESADEPGKEGEARKPIEVYYLPDAVVKSMAEKYPDGQISLQTSPAEGTAPSKLKSLTILENDAVEQFVRLAVAKFYLVARLDTLTLRSTTGLDYGSLSDSLFSQVLPELHGLRELHLSLSKEFPEGEEFYAELWRALPPNLEALHFRGPVWMADRLEEGWVRAFEGPDFLPRLKRLSFVLDLGGEGEDGIERLRVAKGACRRLAEVAEARGVVVEEFEDKWSRAYSRWKGVDERWAGLDVDGGNVWL